MKNQQTVHRLNMRLLRWSLLAWVSIVYIWVISENWSQSGQLWARINPIHLNSSSLILFTALLCFYALLFWAGLVGAIPRKQYWLYFLVQGLLVFFVGISVGQANVALSLYLALILGAFVMLRRSHMLFVVAGSYLALILLCAGLGMFSISFSELFSPESLHRQLVIGVAHWNLPLVLSFFLYRTDYAALLLFVVGFLTLYIQQMRAHTQLADAHAQLEEAHTQVQESSRQIAALTRQAERQRLARELHDTLAQSVAGLIIQLQVACSYQAQEQHELALKSMQQTMASARETLALARGAIDDLRATATPGEFLEAVTDEIHCFSETTGVPCEATGLELLVEMPANCFEHIQRAIREGLMNVTRHARASQVWVEVERNEDKLLVQIRDNGIGFEPDLARIPAGHYGLLGQWERARLIGGNFHISSEPGQGTTVCFSILMEDAKQREVSRV